uniref:Uncharacterized protein n=1 Tax=Arundo donax TaxID=35708 RepID=A0A0A8ZAT7_ARUDO
MGRRRCRWRCRRWSRRRTRGRTRRAAPPRPRTSPGGSRAAPSDRRRLKEMKRTGAKKIKAMLLSRLYAVYVSQEKMREAQKLQKCFLVNSVTKDTIRIV